MCEQHAAGVKHVSVYLPILCVCLLALFSGWCQWQTAPDVTITKTPVNGSVPVNQPFRYNITVTNNGQAPASNVTMVDNTANWSDLHWRATFRCVSYIHLRAWL